MDYNLLETLNKLEKSYTEIEQIINNRMNYMVKNLFPSDMINKNRKSLEDVRNILMEIREGRIKMQVFYCPFPTLYLICLFMKFYLSLQKINTMEVLNKGMEVMYRGKKVKVTKLIIGKCEFIDYPLIVQVRIEWKKNGKMYSDYANADEIEFVEE